MSEAEARSWAILVAAVFTGIVSVLNTWLGTRVKSDLADKIDTVEAKVDAHEQLATTRARLRGETLRPPSGGQ